MREVLKTASEETKRVAQDWTLAAITDLVVLVRVGGTGSRCHGEASVVVFWGKQEPRGLRQLRKRRMRTQSL